MTNTYDALVVGAGYIGWAVAYHLAASGLRTALLDQETIAGGASRANYGNVQVQDAELDHSLPMVTAGFGRFERLEEELANPVGYRRIGSLLLIEKERQWHAMEARLLALHAAGVSAEMVPANGLPEIEPLLAHREVLGACYYPTEGQVYPFALMWAYLRRARGHGLTMYTHTEVIDFDARGGRLRGLRTSQGDLSTGVVVLTTGAWTRHLGRTLGLNWDIRHVHGQAVVTERMEKLLNCHIASAAFFEDVRQEAEVSGARADLAISQATHGNVLLGEAALVTDDLGFRSTSGGQCAIADVVARFFPALRRLRVLRGWAAPVAFTADGLPFFGPVKGIEGLILATAFKSTVVVTPLVGETVAQLVLEGRTDLDLTPFSPDREVVNGQ